MTHADDHQRRQPERDAEMASRNDASTVGPRVDRRRFLKGAGGAAGGAAASVLTLTRVAGQEATPTAMEGHDMAEMAPAADAAKGGFTTLVPFQASILEAAAARLIPSDAIGPGATEAGVVYFIDRQLTTDKGYRGPQYDAGPFLEGEPTQGDQSALEVRDRFRLGIQAMEQYARELYDTGFADLEAEQQDRILRDMEAGTPEMFGGASIQTSLFEPLPSGTEGIERAEAGIGAKAFFDLLLTYTIAGFFADPVQGGNRDMVGWKMIGFPGAHLSHADQILNYGQPFEGEYISLAQYQQQITGGE